MEGRRDVEGELIGRVAHGDARALDALVDHVGEALFRYLRSLVRSDEAAEDALQEVLVGVWRGAGAWRGESAGRVWLYGLARRQAARTWRRRAGEPAHPESLDAVDSGGDLLALGRAAGFGADDPERAVAVAEDVERLHRALDALSPTDREVIVLRDLDGFTGPEVAELLGLELAAMKTRLHRARLRLLAELRSSEGGTRGAG